MAKASETKTSQSQNDNHLVAEPRTSFGKGAARKIRAVGKVPAVIYGHGTDPQHVTLPGHEVSLILRKANQVLELDISGKTQLALVKDVQKDPVHQIIEHLDLVVVRAGEKVTVDVPVHVEGEPFSGTIYNLDSSTLSLEAEATHIPERLVVNIEGFEAGMHILAKEIELPSGSTLSPTPRRSSSPSPSRPPSTSARSRRSRRRAKRAPRAKRVPRARPRSPAPTPRRLRSRPPRPWIRSCGSWSGSGTPGPPTRRTATTSVSGWSTCSPSAPASRSSATAPTR